MGQLELSYTITEQVVEVYTNLAAVDPWLWLRKRVKLTELIWAELARTELTQAEGCLRQLELELK